VEQISLPYRIALGALLVIGALWFTVLRPKPAATPPPTAPGVAGLARATQNAKNAVAASKSSAAESQAAANRVGQTRSATPTKATAGVTKSPAAATSPKATTATPVVRHHRVVPRKTAPGAATKPSPTLVQADGGKDPSAPLLADLDHGRTLVLLFWNKKGSDDRAVRSAVKGVGRHHGKVVVKAIPASQVGDYEAITRGAQVLQSPTILVIGKDKKAHPIIGFTYTGEIDQLVGDVLAGRTP
jgi:cytoskeletal protein RodZ